MHACNALCMKQEWIDIFQYRVRVRVNTLRIDGGDGDDGAVMMPASALQFPV